jgi:hypothetical protein
MASRRVNETPERLRQAQGRFDDVLITDETGQQILRREFLDGHPLRWLLSRDRIDGHQYAAGEQLYRDWYLSGLAASGVIDPTKEPVDGDPPTDVSDVKFAAMYRFRKAVRAIDPLHWRALNAIVIGEESLESYGERTQTRWYEKGKNRTRAALNTLRNALTLLDWHYNGKRRDIGIKAGMSEHARPSARPDVR